MNKYEYACAECGHEVCVERRISAPKQPVEEICLKCGGEMEFIPGNPTVRLRGSGWSWDGYGRAVEK